MAMLNRGLWTAVQNGESFRQTGSVGLAGMSLSLLPDRDALERTANARLYAPLPLFLVSLVTFFFLVTTETLLLIYRKFPLQYHRPISCPAPILLRQVRQYNL